MVLFCQQQQQHHHHQRQHPSSISLISSLRASALIGFLKSREPLFRCDSGACSSFRALLFWCREVLLVLFCQQQKQQQQQQQQQPSIVSSRVPEVTLGTFSVDSGACSSFRAFLFWCREQQQQQRHQPPSISHQFLTVLVPGGAFGTLLSAAATAAATAPAASYLSSVPSGLQF